MRDYCLESHRATLLRNRMMFTCMRPRARDQVCGRDGSVAGGAAGVLASGTGVGVGAGVCDGVGTELPAGDRVLVGVTVGVMVLAG